MTKDITNEFPKSPRSKFYCPLSPYVLWYHGLEFKECPVCPGERNMSSCSGCSLKGESKIEPKDKQKSHRNNKNRDKKDISSTDKHSKDLISKIRKTYSSE
ncbi:MAG: hypothetical protein WC516_04785 [Patescibacteria group bacterium]|jgi:hypothetical protein